MRVDKTCSYDTCTRNCFYDDKNPRQLGILEEQGWLLRTNGEVLCPLHAEYMKAIDYFTQFAAF